MMRNKKPTTIQKQQLRPWVSKTTVYGSRFTFLAWHASDRVRYSTEHCIKNNYCIRSWWVSARWLHSYSYVRSALYFVDTSSDCHTLKVGDTPCNNRQTHMRNISSHTMHRRHPMRHHHILTIRHQTSHQVFGTGFGHARERPSSAWGVVRLSPHCCCASALRRPTGVQP